jgi:hypothetical protein
MQSSGASPNHSDRDSQSGTPGAKKPYSAPKITVLKPDQAEAELKAKGLPGDPGVQKLLGLMARPDEGTMEHRPTLLVELRLRAHGKSGPPELKIVAEYLNPEHLPMLRKYLQISEGIMREAG